MKWYRIAGDEIRSNISARNVGHLRERPCRFGRIGDSTNPRRSLPVPAAAAEVAANVGDLASMHNIVPDQDAQGICH